MGNDNKEIVQNILSDYFTESSTTIKSINQNVNFGKTIAPYALNNVTSNEELWTGAKDGGRIGYQNGELVEQQTDFIEGPQGGEEFQETVVEGQEQPSREQLEALAMEIFQLPLE